MCEIFNLSRDFWWRRWESNPPTVVRRDPRLPIAAGLQPSIRGGVCKSKYFNKSASEAERYMSILRGI